MAPSQDKYGNQTNSMSSPNQRRASGSYGFGHPTSPTWSASRSNSNKLSPEALQVERELAEEFGFGELAAEDEEDAFGFPDDTPFIAKATSQQDQRNKSHSPTPTTSTSSPVVPRWRKYIIQKPNGNNDGDSEDSTKPSTPESHEDKIEISRQRFQQRLAENARKRSDETRPRHSHGIGYGNRKEQEARSAPVLERQGSAAADFTLLGRTMDSMRADTPSNSTENDGGGKHQNWRVIKMLIEIS